MSDAEFWRLREQHQSGVHSECPPEYCLAVRRVLPPEAHPCGHVERVRGCGGCDPSAIEFVRDDGGQWTRVNPAGVGP